MSAARRAGAAIGAGAVACLSAMGGCDRSRGAELGGEQAETPVVNAPDPGTRTMTFRGVLRGGLMGIGGEHTGFELIMDNGTRLELDPGAARGRAQGMDGQRVVVTGTVEDHGYVERGTVKILRATTIEADTGAGGSR